MRSTALAATTCLALMSFHFDAYAREIAEDAGREVVRRSDLKRRCESILEGHLAQLAHSDEASRGGIVSALGWWPHEMVEGTLVSLLKDSSSEARLVAAELLCRGPGADRHRDDLLRCLESLRPADDLAVARVAGLRYRLGHDEADGRLLELADLRDHERRGAEILTCAMHPDVQVTRGGSDSAIGDAARCPICGMDFVLGRSKGPSPERRDAQLVALTALADGGHERTAALAQSVLVDEIEPLYRLFGAYQWARVSPDDGLPHMRVFLSAPNHLRGLRVEALRILAYDFPSDCVEDFREVLAEPASSEQERILALRGLVASGDRDALVDVRAAVDNAPRPDLVPFEAIDILSTYGEAEDIDRLEPLLVTRLRVTAAAALMRLMTRLDRDR